MARGEGAARARRAAKDSVFCDLFSRPRYLLELYRALHPEDAGASESDIELVTLSRVLTAGVYNDLGFTVRGRLVVLVEAQSTWSPNIAVRLLMYLAEGWRREASRRGLDPYGARPLDLPVPEAYVVYTGATPAPGEVSLARDVLGAPDCCLDLRARVVRGRAGDIVWQYAEFCRALDRHTAAAGRTLEAVAAAVDECAARGILEGYLAGRRDEIGDMMLTLFDEEEVRRNWLASERREAREQGLEQGAMQGTARSIGRMVEKLGMSADEAMDVLEVPADKRAAYAAML